MTKVCFSQRGQVELGPQSGSPRGLARELGEDTSKQNATAESETRRPLGSRCWLLLAAWLYVPGRAWGAHCMGPRGHWEGDGQEVRGSISGPRVSHWRLWDTSTCRFPSQHSGLAFQG